MNTIQPYSPVFNPLQEKHSPAPQEKPSNYVFVRLLFLGLIGFFIFSQFWGNKSENTVSLPISKSLEKHINQTMVGAKGTYGIAIKNLKTGEAYYLNEHLQFPTASLYKLWIMAASMQKIENNEIQEDEILSADISSLNQDFSISGEGAELTEGFIQLTVKDALFQMITISHNYAALLLTKKIKLSSAQAFLEENGFKESALGDPKTTPYDMALFFEKLYKGEFGNAENTQRMMDMLKQQTLNNKLPKYIPETVQIAHKTGEIGFFTHDAGIVFADKGDYVIAVLSESDFPPGAEDRISLVAKAVFEYFAK